MMLDDMTRYENTRDWRDINLLYVLYIRIYSRYISDGRLVLVAALFGFFEGCKIEFGNNTIYSIRRCSPCYAVHRERCSV
jgi:hypothetical protein